MQTLSIIDTHTGGEPTRVVFDVPCPGNIKTANERLTWMRQDADWIRRSILLEPRGCESMVGALVAPPTDPANLASVVFFNNIGYLGMCGHGLLGVIEALRYRDGLKPGTYRIETPVGEVLIHLHQGHAASFENVPSYRYQKQVSVEVPGLKVGESLTVGDVAFGGNWFFLTPIERIEFDRIDVLIEISQRIRRALQIHGITGRDGAEIDHIELYSPLSPLSANLEGKDSSVATVSPLGARTFVLCPGGHYDRSPCGTGTSAKLACLAADGTLAPGEAWIQESVLGSRFSATYRPCGDTICAEITGRAFVSSETTCIFDPDDPFRFGIDSASRSDIRQTGKVALA